MKAKLTDLLGSKYCISILMIFFSSPEEELYQADIVKRSNHSKMTVIKWLNFLESYHVLKVAKKGNLKYYSINKENPIIKQLKSLTNTMNVYEFAEQLSGKGLEIYLFGSSARGEDTEQSDIDVLIIGKINKHELVKFIDDVKERMRKNVNPIVMDPFEYSTLYRKDKTFYENVQRDRIRLI